METLSNTTTDKVMLEITNFCMEECSSVLCCPEEDCVLYRIEQVVIKRQDEN